MRIMQITLFLLLTLLLVKCKGQYNKTDDPVIYREANDPELEKAKQEALSNLDYFMNSFNHHSSDTMFQYSLKADFIENGEHEHMWIELIRFSEEKYYGTLGNDPQLIKRLRYGDPVEITRDQIEDWIIYNVAADSLEGGFSVKVLQNRE